MLEDWTHDALTKNLHTLFRFRYEPAGAADLELIEVSGLTRTSHQEMFSILLRGPLAQSLGQGMYTTEHDSLGTVDLFIVPVGREADGMRYEAVFNRLVGP